MKSYRLHLASLLQLIRQSTKRLIMSVLVLLSLLLLLLSNTNLKGINQSYVILTDSTLPLIQLLSVPLESVKHLAGTFGGILAVYEENVRLRAENATLRLWQARAIRLQVQNDSLRELAKLPPDATLDMVGSARILGDSTSPFVHTRLIDNGRGHDLDMGMPVLNEKGLVGRIIDISAFSARVLLITDLNSRIPIEVEHSGDRAILVGDNSTRPILEFLPLNPRFRLGARVITSGDGGLLPPGIPVGTISSIRDGIVRVQPYVDWSRLDYVQIYGRQNIKPPKAEELAVSE